VSSLNTTTTGVLAGTAGAEDTASLVDLQVACQADDDLYVELRPSGVQTIHITDLSIVEYL
jgi:hypothetical protein